MDGGPVECTAVWRFLTLPVTSDGGQLGPLTLSSVLILNILIWSQPQTLNLIGPQILSAPRDRLHERALAPRPSAQTKAHQQRREGPLILNQTCLACLKPQLLMCLTSRCCFWQSRRTRPTCARRTCAPTTLRLLGSTDLCTRGKAPHPRVQTSSLPSLSKHKCIAAFFSLSSLPPIFTVPTSDLWNLRDRH